MNPTARDLGSSFGAHVFLWASDSSSSRTRPGDCVGRLTRPRLCPVSLSSLAVDLSALEDSLQRHGVPCLTGLAVPPDVWAQRRGGGLLRHLKDAIDVTAALGSGILSGALYTPMGEKSDPAERGGESRLIRGELKEVAQYASSQAYNLGWSPSIATRRRCINTCEQVLGFIADIDEPNLSVHLDTFHMNIEERDLYGAITLARDRLGYVQLAESDRGVPGQGSRALGGSVRRATRCRLRGSPCL